MELSELREILMKIKDERRSELDLKPYHIQVLTSEGFAEASEVPPMTVAYDIDPVGPNPDFQDLPKHNAIGKLTPDGEKLLSFLKRLPL